MGNQVAEPDPPDDEGAPGGPPRTRKAAGGETETRERTGPEDMLEEIPPRLVVVAYLLAAVCFVAPLAVLGAAFAGAVLFTRGRRGAGAGVVAVAVLCAALGLVLLS